MSGILMRDIRTSSPRAAAEVPPQRPFAFSRGTTMYLMLISFCLGVALFAVGLGLRTIDSDACPDDCVKQKCYYFEPAKRRAASTASCLCTKEGQVFCAHKLSKANDTPEYIAVTCILASLFLVCSFTAWKWGTRIDK